MTVILMDPRRPTLVPVDAVDFSAAMCSTPKNCPLRCRGLPGPGRYF
jgi:hypothetical protein